MYDPATRATSTLLTLADPRRSRVLQRRRARDGARPGVRDQPAALHLLLAAPGPGLQLVPDRRPQRDQPLHAQRRGHGGRGGVRAGDPARAQGQGRQRQPRRRRGPEHLQRARRRRQHQLRLRRRPLHRHRRRRRPVRAGRQRLRAARPALPGALRRAQHGREHQRPARQGPAHPAAGRRRRRAPASARRTRSRPGTCSRPARRRRSPRSSRWASATRSRSQADPAHPGTVVVGDYGPDAATNNATRGPAGIIEWNRVTRPGFYGWPLCAGDNSAANSYFRYTFPSGPSGTRFDCAAAEIPNESPNNSGLPSIPGPAVAADVWHKRTGDHPARFAIPTRSSPQESITGPVYDYDAANPSTTKWPAYYDGAWLILDRAQNWWRETRDQGRRLRRCCASTACSTPASSARPTTRYPMPVKFGPDGSLYLATWGHDCCRAQLPTSQTGRLMRIDFIGDQVDTTAPVVDGDRRGHRATRAGDYLGRATLHAQRQRRLRHLARRVLAGRHELDPLRRARRVHDARGLHRALPRHRPARTTPRRSSRSRSPSSPARAACRRCRTSSAARSTRPAGATATRRRRTGARAPSVADGSLVLPLGAFSLDLARTGPAAILAQPLPDGDFTLVAKVSAPGLDADVGGQGSTLRPGRPEALPDQRQLDQARAHAQRRRQPDRARRARTSSSATRPTARARSARAPGSATGNLPTWWMRVIRAGATVTAAYSLSDPDGDGRELGHARHGRTSTRSCRRPPARATSASTAATARSRPATTTCASRRTRAIDTAPPVELAHRPGAGRRGRLVPHAGRRRR